MCGVLYAIARDGHLPIADLQSISTEFIAPRGPDHRQEFCSKSEYACQSVLSIQSSPGYPADQGQLGSKNFILFNGEIYDPALNLGQTSDTEKLYQSFLSDSLPVYLRHIDGMYAVITVKKWFAASLDKYLGIVDIYRDPVGEKHIYYWHSDSYFIAASSPGAIAEFIKCVSYLTLNHSQLYSYFSTRHYISPLELPFDGIRQLLPGEHLQFKSETWKFTTAINSSTVDLLDESKFSYLSDISLSLYMSNLDACFREVSSAFHNSDLTLCNAFTISGGIDSTIASFYLDQVSTCAKSARESFTCRFGDKDQSSLDGKKYSKKIGLENHYWVDVNTPQYVEALRKSIRALAAPVHSHSLPSSRLLAEFVSTRPHRVLYGGEGADELFLGYQTYADLLLNEKISKSSSSNYSKIIDIFDDYSTPYTHFVDQLYSQVFDRFMSFRMTPKEAEIKSNALIDFMVQLPMVGLSASDAVISECGIEYRTPFTRKKLVEFAINSPVNKLIRHAGNDVLSKYPLRELFKKHIDQRILPKMGFSGFPNESMDYLGLLTDWRVFELLPLVKKLWGRDRATNWKIINIEWFLRVWDVH